MESEYSDNIRKRNRERAAELSSEDDSKLIEDRLDKAEVVPSTDKSEESFYLQCVPKKWRNYTVRFIITWILLAGFIFIIYLGPVALSIFVLFVQLKCFDEIITIGYRVYRSYNLPWFRTLSWMFLFIVNYYAYGEFLSSYFSYYIHRENMFTSLASYHRMISYLVYIVVFCGFIFSLKKGFYFKQFTMFGFTHVTLLLIVTQSHLIIQNLFEGLVWFVLPCLCVIVNDIMAYMFGYFFGRTPLIKLSPKKTWEGYIGGGLSTIVFAFFAAYVVAQFPHMTCPVNFDIRTHELTVSCTPSSVFQFKEYALFPILTTRKFVLCPFQFHILVIAIFASVIGPFGGFFASGFKRAFKIKDFAETFPGHGGFMDRFDCQILVGTFVHIYVATFIRAMSPQKIIQQASKLNNEDLLSVYNFLKSELLRKNLIEN